MAERLGSAAVEVLADTSPFAQGLTEGVDGALSEVEASVEGTFADASAGASAALDEVGDTAADVGGEVADAFDDATAQTADGFGAVSAAAGREFGDAEAEAADAAAGAAGAMDEAASQIITAAGEAGDGLAEGIGEGTEAAAEAIDEMADGAEEATGRMSDGFAGLAGAAGVGATGMALDSLASGLLDTEAVIGRTAREIGVAEGEVRAMISAVTDWTFATEDAAAGAELLRTRGVDDLGEMERLLPMFDALADSLGEDFIPTTEAALDLMGAFNVPMDDAEQTLGMLRVAAQDAGVDLSQLARMLGRNVDDLDDLGLSLDDAVGAIMAMAAEGRGGDIAMREFQRAVRDSGGETDGFFAQLGLTESALHDTAAAVDGVEESLWSEADAMNEAATTTERLWASTDGLLFRLGPLSRVIDVVSAGLQGLSGVLVPVAALKFVLGGRSIPLLSGAMARLGSVFRGAAAGARGLLAGIRPVGVGMGALASPAAVVVGAVAAIAAQFRLAWGAAEFLEDRLGGVGRALVGLLGPAGVLVAGVRDMRDQIDGASDTIEESRQTLERWAERLHGLAAWLRKLPGRVGAWVRQMVGWVGSLPERVHDAVAGVVDRLREAGRDAIDGLVEGMRDRVTAPLRFIEDLRDRVVARFEDVFAISSPSQLMADAVGGPIVEGIQVGVDRGGFDPGRVAADARRPVAAGGGGGGVTVHVASTEPRRAADETLRRLEAEGLLGEPVARRAPSRRPV